MCAWCVLSFMFVLSRRWPRHWADDSSGEALLVLVWSKKYVYDPWLNSLTLQVVALSGPGGVGHVKVPIRGRLNLDNEMRCDEKLNTNAARSCLELPTVEWYKAL